MSFHPYRSSSASLWRNYQQWLSIVFQEKSVMAMDCSRSIHSPGKTDNADSFKVENSFVASSCFGWCHQILVIRRPFLQPNLRTKDRAAGCYGISKDEFVGRIDSFVVQKSSFLPMTLTEFT
jgi:hypothetical protein